MLKLIRFHLFLVLVLLMGFKAQAQKLASELRFQSDSFVSPNYDSSSSSHFQFLKLNVRNEDSQKDALVFDVRGLFSLNSSLLNSLNATELYYKNTSSDEKTNLWIGRKKWNWSLLDQKWDLGLWEPVFKWNPLSPENQGLTGLFWSQEGSVFQLTLFATPIFIPSQGPQFEMNDQGQFVAANPWYQTPPKSVRISGASSSTDIEYKIQKPTESQVVFHSSYAGQVRVGQKLGPQISLAHASKPMNNLLLAYDGLINVSKDKVEVSVLPFVNYHSITSLDFAYQQEKYRISLSTLQDRPQTPKEVDAKWTKPVLSEAQIVSPAVDLDLGIFSASFSYLKIQGGDLREEGSLANPSQMTLNSVYRFKEAFFAGAGARIKLSKGRVWRTSFSSITSQKNQFQTIKWSNLVKVSSNWNVFGEVQLIKAEDQSIDNRNEIAQYANNDRIMIGAGYVF